MMQGWERATRESDSEIIYIAYFDPSSQEDTLPARRIVASRQGLFVHLDAMVLRTEDDVQRFREMLNAAWQDAVDVWPPPTEKLDAPRTEPPKLNTSATKDGLRLETDGIQLRTARDVRAIVHDVARAWQRHVNQ